MDLTFNKIKGIALRYSLQLIIFFSFIIIYLITRYPGVGGRINFGDSAKWQYLHLANGLPHGTGYPQFLILSEIFSRLIFFLDLSERITFISIFFGALSLAMFYSLLHLLTKDKTGSLISTLLVGFSYVFWTQATEAEVYTLNIFYLLTVFYLFIQFYLTRNSKYYLAGCAVYALSFGNHLSMVTILPAVAFISFITDYRTVFKPKNLTLVALFVLLGALQYMFIYYRAYHSDPHYMEIVPNPTFAQFLTYLTGSDKSTMMAFTFKQIIDERIHVLLKFININFTYIGLLFAFAGFFYYLYVKRAYVIIGFLSLALLGQVAFNISYNVNDLIVFFIPTYVIICIFIGFLFSSHRDVIPKIGLSFLVVYIFINNVYSRDIALKETYWLNHFKPQVSLYYEQKDNLPLYFPIPGSDYFTHNYINYLHLSGTLEKSKSITDDLSLIHSPDSFYVGSALPNLAQNYTFKLVSSESLSEFVQRHNKPQNAIFFSVRDEGAQNLPKEFVNYLKKYGSSIESLPPGGSYAAVLFNGKMVELINGSGRAILKSGSIDNDPLEGKLAYKVYSAGNQFGDSSVVEIKGYDYSVNRRGMNLVVYDNSADEITDMVSFDITTREVKRLFKAIKNEYIASQTPKAPVGKIIALRGFNDLYVSGENGTAPLTCNKESIGAWEKFEVVDAGSGKIAFKSEGMYLSSENGNGPMLCNRTGIGDWEKFELLENADGTVSVRGSNWFIVSVENETGPLTCNTSSLSNREKFTIQIIQ